MGVGKVCLLTTARPRKHVERGGKPALILGEQRGNKRSRRCWACAHQILPCRFRAPSARNLDSARADAEPPSVKIKDRAVLQQFANPNRLLQKLTGFGINPGEGPV